MSSENVVSVGIVILSKTSFLHTSLNCLHLKLNLRLFSIRGKRNNKSPVVCSLETTLHEFKQFTFAITR